ncbi:FAD binding domain-containing protein [Ancylobacter sp. SL191]|uniref:FAD binding domain-containing protein n=1 Tax=Ancylobacter sp. SL191 TaxID=2995166 RepID=UPI002271EF31|nr:xanthine dehydrogenase family protein subunit M [Ancylobacter sp. SL191]WAC25611.1 xanthine dehydrogenase family protein subunit M [Ancylobacter sp. SL191]
MKPSRFQYHRATDVPHALALLREHAGDTKILAGGQSLVPAMNFRLARPGVLIDINAIEGLAGVTGSSAAGLTIGALTRHAAFHTPVEPGPVGALLARVVTNIAHYPIRQRGTFGGSLSHADPASEWCLTAMTLDAVMVICGPSGERRVPAPAFFRGTFTTAIGEEDLLRAIEIPPYPGDWRGGFYEFSRRKGDFALAMALAFLRLEDGRIAEARLGLGSVSDRPIRLTAGEAMLCGRAPDAALFREVAADAQGRIEPSGDIHASSEYRRDLVGTVIERALARACGLPDHAGEAVR